MDTSMLDRELKKGSAELLLLSLVADRARHGYEISKLIESRSEGMLKFNVASLYPLLYRLEARGWIIGRWVDEGGQCRRPYHKPAWEGNKVQEAQRSPWKAFPLANGQITGVENA